MNESYSKLQHAFERYEKAFTSKASNTEKSSEEEALALQDTLSCLEALGYQKRELLFIFDVESLTYERWKKGSGMKPNTFRDFQSIILDILAGKSQKPIIISHTGLVDWRYVFEERQPQAERIWYVSEGQFLSEKSTQMETAVHNLFLKKDAHQPFPRTLVYLYPEGSQAESSLADWGATLEKTQKEANFKGTVIGIKVPLEQIPWFQPSIRTMIMEMPGQRESVEIEAYLRTKVAKASQAYVFNALDTEVNDQHLPWLSVESEVAVEWYKKCRTEFASIVTEACHSQKEPFSIHYL